MPPLSSLALGIQTLTEAIQLNPIGPAQGILTISRNILQMVDSEKSGSQDRQRLVLLVLDIAILYSEGMKKLDENERDSNDIKRTSSKLFNCLESISQMILDKSKRRWLARTIRRSATKKTLQGCEADLHHISSILETQFQLRNVKNSGIIVFTSQSREAGQALEEKMSQAHQQTLDLIKFQVLEQRRQRLERSSFAHPPPVPSQTFFGRSDLVDQLVESLVNVPAYHAVLGQGGIGKTSLALNVLQDPRITTVYGSHRYFLACDTIADASGIIAGVSDLFNLDEGSFLKSFRRHCEIINSSMLFLLDNFETPWERQETRPKVEELLTQLCDIPNLSIIVTLRGAERPYGVHWTRPFFPIVGPLEFAAACQTFMSIADVREDDADMIELLEEVEGIPLAITLLAAQAQYTSCTFLLDQWRTCKTSMVTRGPGWESRLSSLDVSISLSLTSTRFTSNPIALPLLQVLSLLPDGTTVEELVAMTPNHFDVRNAVPTIFQIALAYTSAQGRLSVLAPIREYVQSTHPISPSLLNSVFSYHSKLSKYAFTSSWTTESPVMEADLIRCISNIHSVLRVCLKVDNLSEESIKAVVNVSSFRRDKDLGFVSLLLEESITRASLLQKPSLHAACLTEMGHRMIYNPESRASAIACLEEAVNQFQKLPESSDQLVFALTALASLFNMLGRYEEGIKCGQESVRLIKESTSPVISGLAYIWLGDNLMRTRDFPEGTKSMNLATSCFQPMEYPILAQRYSISLSEGYMRRNLVNKAIEAADFSLNLNLNMGNARTRRHYGAARLLGDRGYAYMYVGRYEDAINDFQESIDALTSYAMEFEIADALTCLGIARLGCSDFKAASTAFQVALRIPYRPNSLPLTQCLAALELCQDHIEQAFICCAKAKEDIYQAGIMTPFAASTLLQVQSQAHIRRGDATDALSMSVLSVIVSYKMADRGDLARQFLVLGDVYVFIEKDIATAKACYQAALDLMRYLGLWRWIANALTRLGVLNHLQGDSSLARRRLNQAIEFYEKTAGMAWVEYCKDRLRVIKDGIVEEKVPFFPPTFECF